MKPSAHASAIVAIFLLFISNPAVAQTPLELASQLKEWRAVCTDPDPDVQVGGMLAALNEGDQTIIRVCAGAGLNSDNPDMRNLSLRAVLASLEQIRFGTDMPPELAAAYEATGSDQAKRAELDQTRVASMVRGLAGGVAFHIQESSIESGSADWYSITNRDDVDERYRGRMTLMADRISWEGRVVVFPGTYDVCALSASLTDDAMLAGTLKCGQMEPLPIKVELL
ncbi:MAG: hypothetical protein NXH88_15340 [Hyphomonas sp.]|nr:hypothetical protein [Hyphomonas sp.]